jgi:hypothetical protein
MDELLGKHSAGEVEKVANRKAVSSYRCGQWEMDATRTRDKARLSDWEKTRSGPLILHFQKDQLAAVAGVAAGQDAPQLPPHGALLSEAGAASEVVAGAVSTVGAALLPA